jgi:hypothetical protein
MIEILKTGELPFEQLFNRRRIVYVQACDLYTDGSNRYLEIAWKNRFYEHAFSIRFELNQFNAMNQLLRRDLLSFQDFYCQSKATQRTQPIAILPECEQVKIRLVYTEFANVILKEEVFYDGFEDHLTYQQKPSKKNKKHSLMIENRMVQPLGVWFWFLVVVVVTLTIAIFQFPLI